MTYYTYSDTLLPNTIARSQDVKSEFEAIETGLATIPSPAELKLGTVHYATAGGTADAYLATLPYVPASYVTGMMVAFKAGANNTGASTINVNSLGVKAIKRPDNTALEAGDIATTAITVLYYNGTDFIIGNGLPGIQAAAAASASAAASSATDAQTAETNAETAETNAETAQGLAETAQAAAEAAQLAAETAETHAETAETNAETAQGLAEAAQLAAEAAQGLAEAAQSAAETAKGLAEAAQSAAETAQTNAETAETNAEAAETNVVALYDAFDDRYLGSKAADPTLDNDGNALLTGALYWNSTAGEMRVYSGSAWGAAYVPDDTYLPLAGGELSGDIDANNNDVIGLKTCLFDAEYDNGNSGASKTVTLTNGQKQKITLTEHTTLTITATSSGTGHYQLRMIQGSGAPFAVTFSGISSTQWLGYADQPPINSLENGESIVTFFVAGSTMICGSINKIGAP